MKCLFWFEGVWTDGPRVGPLLGVFAVLQFVKMQVASCKSQFAVAGCSLSEISELHFETNSLSKEV